MKIEQQKKDNSINSENDSFPHPEKQFHQIMENVHLFVVTLDAEGTITFINNYSCKLLGWDKDELVKSNWFDKLVPSEVREERRRGYLANIRAGIDNYLYQNELLTSSGEKKIIKRDTAFIKNENGQNTGCHSIGEDVTDKIKGEAKLKASNALLKATFESTADGILVVDHTGKITDYNQKFLEIWEIPEDVIKKSKDEAAISYVLDQLKDPGQFKKSIQYLYDHPDEEAFDIIEFKNGKIIERFTKPQYVEGENCGRVWNFRDITQKIEIEKELTTSKANLQAIFDHTPVGFSLQDKEGNIISFNKTAFEHNLLFLNRTIKEGQNTYNLSLPEHREYYKELNRRVLEDNETIQVEMPLKGHWFNFIFYPVKQADEVIGVGMSILDIHDKKEQEEELKSKKEEFESFFSHAAIGLAKVSLEGRFLKVNKKLCKITEYNEEELLKKKFLDITHPDDVNMSEEFRRKLLSGEINNFSTVKKYISKSGELIYISLRANLLRDENRKPLYFLSAFEDITDRLQAEENLRISEERFRSLVSNLPGIVYRCAADKDWTMYYISNEIENLSGYSADEFLKGRQTFANIIHQDDRKRVEEKVFDAIDKEVPFIIEYRLIHKDGSVKWVYEKGQPIHDESDNVLWLDGAIFDITERKKTEELKSIIYNIASKANETVRLDDFYQFIHQELSAIIDADNIYIAIYNKKSNEVRFTYRVEEDEGWDDFSLERRRRRNGNGLTEYIIRNKKPLLLKTEDIIALRDRREIEIIGTIPKIWLGLPLRHEKEIIGMIALQSYKSENAYNREDLKLLKFVSEHIGMAVKKKNDQEKITESAARLKAIFNSGPHLLWTVNRNINFTTFNKNYANAVYQVHGVYPRINQDLDNPIPRFGTKKQQKFWDNKYKEAFQGKHLRFETFLKDKKGNEIWREVYLNPIKLPDGRIEEVSGQANNITHRKKAEEKIWRTQTFLNSVVDHIPHMVFVKEAKGFSFITLNKAGEELLGLSREKLIGKTDFDFFPRKEAEFFRKKDKEVLENGKMIDIKEETVYTNTKGFRILHTKKIPLYDDEGEPKYLLGISEDVTERKKAEEKLKENEKLYRLLTEQSEELICLHSADGKYKYVSPSVKSLTGWKPSDLEGKDPYEFFHPKDIDRIKNQSHNKVLEGEKSSIIYRFRKKDGSYIWFETLASPINIEDGQVEEIQTSSRDITEQKNAEAKLRESEVKFRRIFNSIEEVYIQTKINGTITMISPSVKKMLGYDQDELIGKNIKMLYNDPSKRTALLEELESKGIADNFEIKFKKKDGKAIDIVSTPKFVYNETGKVIGVEGVVIDISAKKAVENELLRAKMLAEETSMAKTEFLANMSHELRTPLNSILGMADLLLESGLGREQDDYVSTIRESGKTLLYLIEDILDLSTLETQKIKIRKKPVQLKVMLEQVMLSFESQAKNKKLKISYNIDENVPEILELDKLRLLQVLNNLISNAIKFTNEGEVKINIQLAEQNKNKNNIDLIFFVKDTGIGIKKEEQHKLFKKFSQLDSSISKKYKGTGLGLAICRELVELMDGEISLKSEEGKGSTFYFTLLNVPVVEKIDQKLRNGNNNINFESSILLIEDDDVNRKVIKKMLSRYNAKVKTASNGDTGIKKALREDFDLIFLDLHMPDKSGDVVLKELIKKHPALPPVVFLTANTLEDNKMKVLSDGAADYLTKPVEGNQLKQVLLKYTGSFIEDKPGKDNLSKASAEIINDDFFKRLRKILGDEVKEILQEYVESTKDNIEEIKINFKKREYTNAAEVAHRLKGTSATLGIKTIAELSGYIEKNINEKKIGDILKNIDELEDYFNQIKKKLLI